MPTDFMDWVVVIGVIFTGIALVVAFMRRPKKTMNKISGGHGNKQSGGEGTTHNSIKDGNDNEQSG